ncbi:MAG: SufE family protein [Fibrobacter sp.]|nr:SufE family protein [Fibrobacter sp.]
MSETPKNTDEIAKRQETIREVFANFSDSDQKWKYLLQLARDWPGMDSSLQDEKFLIKGCSTRMYLVPSFKDGVLHFDLDTESGADNPLISRGLGVLALQIYNDLAPAEILHTDPEFFQNIGLNVGLSPTRANGFASLLKQIYMYAQVFARF